jgi:hypothetical protein
MCGAAIKTEYNQSIFVLLLVHGIEPVAVLPFLTGNEVLYPPE